MAKQQFWERWLRGETRQSLITWLESQGVYIQMGVEKLTLKQLQWMTFEEDYSFFWATIERKYTGLPVDIRLDEIGILRQPKLLHYAKPLLTFQNNYDQRIYFDVLPMSIARDPKVLEDEKYIKIKPEDVEAVRQFVIKHYDLLMKHRNQKMTTMELYEILKSERNR